MQFLQYGATKGDEILLSQLNSIQKDIGGEKILNLDDQINATQKWPMDSKEQYIGQLWSSCNMPDMREFIDYHRPYLDWSTTKPMA